MRVSLTSQCNLGVLIPKNCRKEITFSNSSFQIPWKNKTAWKLLNNLKLKFSRYQCFSAVTVFLHDGVGCCVYFCVAYVTTLERFRSQPISGLIPKTCFSSNSGVHALHFLKKICLQKPLAVHPGHRLSTAKQL